MLSVAAMQISMKQLVIIFLCGWCELCDTHPSNFGSKQGATFPPYPLKDGVKCDAPVGETALGLANERQCVQTLLF